jgi:lipoic acid synthetase
MAYAVVTSVTRDDLPDGGAGHVARTVKAIRSASPETRIEVLAPDFRGNRSAIEEVLRSGPDVFGHNIETVARLHPVLRDVRYRYARSLAVLRIAAAWSRRHDLIVKSGFMVGHGETETEVLETLEDLLEAGCAAVSIGQYLRPTAGHRVVMEFVPPERFRAYERLAYELGFAYAGMATS